VSRGCCAEEPGRASPSRISATAVADREARIFEFMESGSESDCLSLFVNGTRSNSSLASWECGLEGLDGASETPRSTFALGAANVER
jgi:hypothetical protein